MKILKLTFTYILILFSKQSFEQTQISQQLLASAGAVESTESFLVSFSIGEPIIGIVVEENFIVTQGFHQANRLNEDMICLNCLGSFDGDCIITASDLSVFLGDFGCLQECEADLNNDETVNIQDLSIFLALFGTNCSN